MACARNVASLLVFTFILFGRRCAGCPLGCLCTSDILSCGGQGLEHLPSHLPLSTSTLDFSHNRVERLEVGGFAGLRRLEILRLSHNRLSGLGPGIFRNASSLRHLDLSCNSLRVLDSRSLQGLPALEELLLFGNRIARVENRALAGLGSLRRAYLSHNRLTNFPFFAFRAHTNPLLVTLDLSSNRLAELPVEEIASLPVSVQGGLFLHNNTLVCECGMYGLFRAWEGRGYASVRDHRDDHTCLVFGDPRASIRFLRHSRFFENCTLPPLPRMGAGLRAQVGDPLLLHCLTSLRGQHLSYLWVSPQQEYVVPPGNNDTLRVFANGSLWIAEAKAEDSGVYLCVALDPWRLRNETWEVNVTVSAWCYEGEAFNTGFTTLLGCGVSLLLVLMYLYLTPCRCWCCRRRRPTLPPAPPPSDEGPALLSAPSPVPPSRRLGSSKHVAFLEPIRDVQNGRLRPAFIMGSQKFLQVWEDHSPVGTDPQTQPQTPR
ncbi:hypothetical protein JZ751_005599 [Albula glossodonta]|uniref:Ig-like domain-containing protein n=1 Tax=Albula glossodonta TaxID=121402 RepID=A0A8T2NFA2_9TELE|nr:hypothetical protein JZ751_005599 [Albula glossodonta]